MHTYTINICKNNNNYYMYFYVVKTSTTSRAACLPSDTTDSLVRFIAQSNLELCRYSLIVFSFYQVIIRYKFILCTIIIVHKYAYV